MLTEDSKYSEFMNTEVNSNTVNSDLKPINESYALRLGGGSEFAEFSPDVWRLTVYHILGVNRQASLGYAEAYLLKFFIENAGEMISRQDLMDHAWEGRIVSQGSLNQAISNLRSLLGDDQKREIILTIPRRGYQFSADSLIDWHEWLIQKQEIFSDQEVEPLSTTSSQKVQKNYYQFFALTVFGTMLLSLLIGVFTNYYYDIFPPYVSEEFETENTELILLAKNQKELEATRDFLQPVFKRMDAVGGRVLINRVHDYLEINCLRPDGTMQKLFVHVERIQNIDDIYLRRCLA